MTNKLSHYIVYDEGIPVFLFSEIDEAFDYMMKLINYSKNNKNNKIEVRSLIFTKNGSCIDHCIYKYDNKLNKIISETTIYDNNKRYTVQQNNKIYSINEPILKITTKNNVSSVPDIISQINNDTLKELEEADLDESIKKSKSKLDRSCINEEFIDDSEEDISDDDTINKEIIVNISEKLNNELFAKRCAEQTKRKEDQKINEKISIFTSDKNTYLIMQSKVKKNILKETNISPLFIHKYYIIKFMENLNLISLTNNKNSNTEIYIYDQLYKVIEGINCDDSFINSFNDIDDEYLLICEKFVEYIEENEIKIMTDKKVHEILNSDSEKKKQLFLDVADQTVFTRDIGMDQY